MAYFDVCQLHKQYAGRPVFTDLNLQIEAGEFITLLGPSGCGKSTLLRCMAGLSRPDSGQIIMAGEDITHRAPQKRDIGMVFQSYALFPTMTVQDNVAFGLRMQGVSQHEQKTAVRDILELVELTGKEQSLPGELSGGQQQRVALARALVVKPRLLLLDEPLSALDARIRRHLREQIRAIQQQMGLTTVFVTHDQEEALTLSDRIVLMHDGQIVQADSAEMLYTRPANRFAAEFIGHYNLLDGAAASQLLQRSVHGNLAIRPESITLVAPTDSTIQGQILGHQLLGNVIRYQVACAGSTLKVDALNRDAQQLLPRGSQVGLVFAEPELCEVA